MILPGAIELDSTADFAALFQNSEGAGVPATLLLSGFRRCLQNRCFRSENWKRDGDGSYSANEILSDHRRQVELVDSGLVSG